MVATVPLGGQQSSLDKGLTVSMEPIGVSMEDQLDWSLDSEERRDQEFEREKEFQGNFGGFVCSDDFQW